MAKYLVLAVFVIIFLGLEIGLLPSLAIFGGIINLIILILISSFFLEVEKEGLVIALILAGFYDLYLYSFFGLSMTAVLVIYYLLLFFKNKIAPESDYLLLLVFVFLASLFFDLVVSGSLCLKYHFDFSYVLLYTILPNALINLVVAVPFFMLARKIVSILKLYRLLKPKEKKISVGNI